MAATVNARNRKGRKGRIDLSIDSELVDPEFRLLPTGRADLNEIPIFPGGILCASFRFTSSVRSADGLYLKPDLAAAWKIEARHGQRKDRSRPEPHYGGEGTECAPCAVAQYVTISSFDPATGTGQAEIQAPLLVGWPGGPPVFEGHNEVTVWVAPRATLKRELLGPPSAEAHRFVPISLEGHLPPASLCLNTFRLSLGQTAEATLVLSKPADRTLNFKLEAVWHGKSAETPEDLRLPASIRIERGALFTQFPVTFQRGCCGGDGILRLQVSGSGLEAFSAPLALSTMSEAAPGLATAPTPLLSQTHSFKKCTRKAAPFNLPPGAVWVEVGPCLGAQVGPPPVPPPPVAGGPVLLYIPHECTFAFDRCVVFPTILNGTLYNKVTVTVVCAPTGLAANPTGLPFPPKLRGLQTITIYTAIGPGRAVVDDCI